MSLLTGAARTATIRVKEDAEFVVIDRESFRDTLIHNPSIAESLSRILAERQAALAAQREKLDAVTLERRKRTNRDSCSAISASSSACTISRCSLL